MTARPLVLGAGPAGCAAAIVMAEAGAAPVLLDRSAQAGDALCGGFLSWRTAGLLRELGVDPAALGGRSVRTLALYAGRRHAAIPLPGTGYGLSRRTLDTALRIRAAAAGAELACDTARCIEGLSVIGRARTWQAASLFLATGKHDLRGEARPRPSRDSAVGIRLRLPPSATRTALLRGRIELHLFRSGYAGIVLQEDGAANLCLAVRKSELAGNPVALLDRLTVAHPALAERMGDDWRAVPCDSIGAVPYGFRAQDAREGLFRLGDQAAVIPSLAGEGIAIALASGALSARMWLARGAAAAPAFQRALARRTGAPLRTASLAWHLAEHPVLARLGVAGASRLPAAVRWVMDATRLDPAGSLAPARAAS